MPREMKNGPTQGETLVLAMLGVVIASGLHRIVGLRSLGYITHTVRTVLRNGAIVRGLRKPAQSRA